jgi:hypothetical protein
MTHLHSRMCSVRRRLNKPIDSGRFSKALHLSNTNTSNDDNSPSLAGSALSTLLPDEYRLPINSRSSLLFRWWWLVQLLQCQCIVDNKLNRSTSTNTNRKETHLTKAQTESGSEAIETESVKSICWSIRIASNRCEQDHIAYANEMANPVQNQSVRQIHVVPL